MAQKIQVSLISDVDGAPADESVTIGLDGVAYELDLTTAQATELRDALAPWVKAGRKVGGRTAPRGKRAGRGSSDAQAIRDWAKANGHTVSERGRISAHVQDAYATAH